MIRVCWCRLAAAALPRGRLGQPLGSYLAQTQPGAWETLPEWTRGAWAPRPAVALSTSAALRGAAQGPEGPRAEGAASEPAPESSSGSEAREAPTSEQQASVSEQQASVSEQQASVSERVMDAARDAAKAVFFAALLANLREEAPSVEQEMLKDLLEAKFRASWERHKHRAQGASAGPVTAACLVVAANQVAGPWLGRDPDRFRETLLLLLGGKTASAFGFVHRLSLMLRRDKVAYVGTLMERMTHDWGPAFAYERSSGPGREQVRVTRCAYAEILDEEGAASLTPIFCALERQWFDTLRLSRSKVAFDVPSRLADGASSCLFEATQE